MKYAGLLALLVLAGCEDILAPSPYAGRWTLSVPATDCWAARTVSFSVSAADVGADAGLVSEWEAPGGAARVAGILDPSSYFDLAFFPASGGRAATFYGDDMTPSRMAGTFRDPHGILTAGGPCVAEAVATH